MEQFQLRGTATGRVSAHCDQAITDVDASGNFEVLVEERAMSSPLEPPEADWHRGDWYEATARERVAGLLDPKSFVEFRGPGRRAMSPYLAQLDLTGAFGDGIVVGRGRLDDQEIFVAAQ